MRPSLMGQRRAVSQPGGVHFVQLQDAVQCLRARANIDSPHVTRAMYKLDLGAGTVFHDNRRWRIVKDRERSVVLKGHVRCPAYGSSK
jgi:hypothetical protein